MDMRTRRWLTLVLIAALLMTVLPVSAMAAKKARPSIKLSGKVGFMYIGATVQLKPKLKNVDALDVRFSSSDEAVATVSAAGEIAAASVGRAVITVTGSGATAKCGVVVLPRSVSVAAGSTVNLPNGTVERYAVKDKRVATISKKGVITGRKAGSTMIALKYGRQKLTVEVTVTGAAEAGDSSPAEDTGAYTGDSRVEELEAARQTDQIVLVEYKGGSSATLSVHEKRSGIWHQLLETPAYVGKNGIGKTVEGDKKTPKGTYNLTTPFGILGDPGAAQPYTKVTKYHYWCGSSSSKYYNQLVDSRVTGRKCTSSDEHLIDYKGAYNYCMFIDYNSAGTPHKGSCIFLHCFGKNKYTAGCVAISQDAMKQIVQWARSGAKIVIV